MLRVTVSSATAEGKSTLAALIARGLRSFDLPVELVDPPEQAGSAAHLLADTSRLDRNVASVVGRERAAGRSVLVITQNVAESPRVNIPGDSNKYVWRVVESIRKGEYKAALERMKTSLVAYGPAVADVVRAAATMGFMTATEVIAFYALYEASRRSCQDYGYYAELL